MVRSAAEGMMTSITHSIDGAITLLRGLRGSKGMMVKSAMKKS